MNLKNDCEVKRERKNKIKREREKERKRAREKESHLLEVFEEKKIAGNPGYAHVC